MRSRLYFQFALRIQLPSANEKIANGRLQIKPSGSGDENVKMTDVPSKHVWKIKESCYVYTTVYIVAAI